MFTVVAGEVGAEGPEGPSEMAGSMLDVLAREGARWMLAAALEAEVAAYIDAHTDQLDEQGHRLVVRNGHAVPRSVSTVAGAIEVVAPRVNDKRVDEAGERVQFSSSILPAWCRRSPQVTEVLPLLYLHGLSSLDFVPALGQFLGSSAGLSAATVTRLTQTWQAEQKAFAARDLRAVDYVYVWADTDPRQHRAGGGDVVPAGADRGPRGRPQGAHHPR